MEKLASLIIIVGSLFWVISIFFLGARWQPQMFAALIVIIGIFLAHFWEEVFRGEEKD
jgi:drug/metabolite transporter (DMT)-like permease